jgi:hypothetical protein
VSEKWYCEGCWKAHLINHWANFILAEQVGNLARGENVIDVLNKSLVLDLCLIKQESCGLVLAAAEFVELLQVLPKLSHAIIFRDLDAEALLLRHIRGQSCQALAARAACIHQQTSTQLLNVKY